MKRFSWMLALVLAAPLAIAEEIKGKVVAITDGDTAVVLDRYNEQHKIRLHGIDAPEKKQAYGRESSQHLGGLIHEKTVKVIVKTIDRYGRKIGVIKLGRKDINAAMVEDGYAWAYLEYSKQYAPQQIAAMLAGRGLWALQPDQKLPPWQWRKCRRERNC